MSALKLWLLVLLSAALTAETTARYWCPGDDVVEVFVVLNSRGFVDEDGEAVWRRLELLWHTSEILSTDQVMLFDVDPHLEAEAQPLLTVNASNFRDNFFTTSITLDKFNFSRSSLESRCLGYFVSYIRNGVEIASNCLRSRPTWMEDNLDLLKNFHLHEIMIPGTHDTASYHDYEGRETDIDLLVRYGAAQEESVYEQFCLGVRYVDIRAAYYPGTEHKFWINHGAIPFRPFSVVLQDLVDFMEHSNEIVIFEIGGFTGEFPQHPEAYQQLLDLVVPRVSRWMAPMPSSADNPDHHVLLGDLWASGRRLVLVWDADPGNYTGLWGPKLPRTWHDDNTPEQLYRTLDRCLREPPQPRLWSLSGQMTPHAEDIVFDRLTSLRDMADTVNRNVTRMVRYDWWNKTNIVLADFFMGTYNTDTAPLVNWQRANC